MSNWCAPAAPVQILFWYLAVLAALPGPGKASSFQAASALMIFCAHESAGSGADRLPSNRGLVIPKPIG